MRVELVNIRELPWVNRGIVYTITDLLSGLKYNIVGEHNNQRHADYVCATRADTDIKLRTANNNFNNNWTARPVILTIGDRHFAASTHNAAHAPDMTRLRNPRDIGHNGHFCVWVLEATTGGSESYRRSMLAAVNKAFQLAQTFTPKEDEPTETEPEEEPELRFNTIEELPEWGVPTIQKLVERGLLQGTGNNLDISADMLRMFVINDRAGLYDK